MPQKHSEQFGLFHITTNAQGRVPWCTMQGIPEILIRDLFVAKVLYHTKIYAFCILPDHIHLLLMPGDRGLSKFIESFKKNSSRNIGKFLAFRDEDARSDGYVTVAADEIPFTGWQHGFHDEHIRDERQRNAALRYVQCNAWRHGLTDHPEIWPWSSLHFDHVIDAVAML